MAFDAEPRMEKTVASLKDEFNTIRTGRASASLFDKVRVNYYGDKAPLNQVATVSIPEARSVVISPFDKSLITDIDAHGFEQFGVTEAAREGAESAEGKAAAPTDASASAVATPVAGE